MAQTLETIFMHKHAMTWILKTILMHCVAIAIVLITIYIYCAAIAVVYLKMNNSWLANVSADGYVLHSFGSLHSVRDAQGDCQRQAARRAAAQRSLTQPDHERSIVGTPKSKINKALGDRCYIFVTTKRMIL